MASIRVSPSVERLIAVALKKLPVSQTREQFIEDAVSHYVGDLKKKISGLKILPCMGGDCRQFLAQFFNRWALNAACSS